MHIFPNYFGINVELIYEKVTMRNFIELKNNKGETTWIDPSTIVAIENSPNVEDVSIVYCAGLTTPFGITMSGTELLKKLTGNDSGNT
jgi:hypothetical protein